MGDALKAIGLLLRMRSHTRMALGPGGMEPLFPNAGMNSAFGLTSGTEWYRAPLTEAGVASAWDAAHEAVQGRFGLDTAAGAIYAEPDLLQQWPWVEEGEAFAAGSAGGRGVSDEPDRRLPPSDYAFDWHLQQSQLGEATREVLSRGLGGRRVRVGVVDTGWDPGHVARPERVTLQRNFVEGGTDARDPGVEGLGRQPGHGTGTLGILAAGLLAGVPEADALQGRPLGGVPFAEVVPVRVANSVVQFTTSAFARGIDYLIAPDGRESDRCDVISISMGGVPSGAWTDVVNRAYEAGVVVVAAAGNNVPLLGPFRSPRSIVYPARYRRVIAACGVMADGTPYADLGTRFGISTMEGNYGPDSKMATALAAFTPNIPWAELGAPHVVDRNGRGTSAATPQVAAAAALWLQIHDPRYGPEERWKRVEAVRQALFSTAARGGLTAEQARRFYGNGVVQARAALRVGAATSLQPTPRDTDGFAFLRVLTGLGVATPSRDAMFQVEAMQLLANARPSEALRRAQESLTDPDLPAEQVPSGQVVAFLGSLLEAPEASRALKFHLERHYRELAGTAGAAVPVPAAKDSPIDGRGSRPRGLAAPEPNFRRLQAYAFDPSLSTRLETAVVNRTVLQVPWEGQLQPGPCGEYLEVIDIDPPSLCGYAPVDLNDPLLLAQDGLPPSEGNPQFHQQMVYAVAMRTIRAFEGALGRKAFWAPGERLERGVAKPAFLRQLRVYPHALREANAYYSPARKALLFGYFPASADNPDKHYPGGVVFTCLSHDIIAHETTHALLDGMNRRLRVPSNPDVLAFHEGFADLVALLQHFSLPDVLRHQIARTRGDLESQSLLGELAQQFGQATGMHGALRSAIGAVDPKSGQWRPLKPDPQDYATKREVHERGAILVAAVFDAFLQVYRSRVADLLRIATNGTGILPAGAIHPDLVERLSGEAAKSAQHVLTMCIRALDYLPPVDVTFGDYLRALITADFDAVPDDQRNYRVAFVEAFRRRGIYPRDVRTLSVDSLRWQRSGSADAPDRLRPLFDGLRRFADEWAYLNERAALFNGLEAQRLGLEEHAHAYLAGLDAEQRATVAGDLGLDPGTGFQMASLRVSRRVTPAGEFRSQAVIEVIQEGQMPLDDDSLAESVPFLGGATVIYDLQAMELRYNIIKNVNSATRRARERDHLRTARQSLRAAYFREARVAPGRAPREPFALLHRL